MGVIALALFISLDLHRRDDPVETAGSQAQLANEAPPRLILRGRAVDSAGQHLNAHRQLPTQDRDTAAQRIELPPREESLFQSGDEPEYDANDLEEVHEYRPLILNSPDPDERETAVFMLSGNEHPEAIETFVAALEDSDKDVRLAAVEALDDESDDLNLNLFTPALDDPDPDVRYAAVEAIGSRDGPLVYSLISRALTDPNEDVRELAQALLPDG